MAAKKGKVTIVIPFTVETESKDDLVNAVSDVANAITERVKVPARLKMDGVKVTFGEVTAK